jgi:two-component system sensor histidine kinase BaeS
MRNINQMAHALKKLEASRRQWIADISHELRTPLTVLRGEIDALIDNIIVMSPQALLSLREEVQQLSALVDDLHLLAMADLRALPCYFEDVEAAALIAGVVQRFARRAAEMKITLTLAADLPDPIWVRWDARRIEQLLGNLLDNSLRYTDAPGQTTVAIHAVEEHVVITVEDSTPSVAQHDLSRIFEPLYRADVSRSKKAGGSGLGLAICDQIAKAHHGSLRATASSLGGLRFTLELPWMGDLPNE